MFLNIAEYNQIEKDLYKSFTDYLKLAEKK